MQVAGLTSWPATAGAAYTGYSLRARVVLALLMEHRRFWRRYLTTNSEFLWRAGREIIERRMGRPPAIEGDRVTPIPTPQTPSSARVTTTPKSRYYCHTCLLALTNG